MHTHRVDPRLPALVAHERGAERPGRPSQRRPRGGGSAPAGSADAFFDDAVLQDIRLTINSKDWQTLKDNYLSNEYYPCDFEWRGQK
ncbi:MAG TPA: hypothetical protein PKA64_24290, partial [Myxococcota bacterium]|nr:hypothetical protein [Myxococcota bacterium]